MKRNITVIASFFIIVAGITGQSFEAFSKSGASLSASASRGRTPLHVVFTGDGGGATFFGGLHIDFGDGTSQNVCSPGQSCKTINASHTYLRSGSYIATLRGVGEGQNKAVARVTIRAR